MAKSQEIKLKVEGKYNGHSTKANKSVNLGFKFPYSEMVNCVQLLQMLNNNVTIAVKVGNSKPKKLGMFMVWEVKFDHDGECIVKFNSTTDYVEQDNLTGLAGEALHVLFKASIEEESEDGE